MAVSYFYMNQCLHKIQLLRRRFLHQALGKLNMHPSQLPILRYIQEHCGCTQAEIAENLALTPAAITLATQRLQKEQLIEKRTDSNNLRRNILTLTPKGEARIAETEAIFDAFDRKMFQGITEAELEQFQGMLDQITMNITGEKTNDVSRQAMDSLMRQLHDTECPKS